MSHSCSTGWKRAKAVFLVVFLFLHASLCFAEASLAVKGAKSQVGKTLIYDPSYVRLKYPGGDVPMIRGVCTDVVIRALRNAGVDLQKRIHEDMKENFKTYPNLWSLNKPDPNIDHRRVPNIVTYYKRKKKTLPLPVKAENVREGDLIAWVLDNGRPHIGVVTSTKDRNKILIVHNIGWGAREEAVLNDWKITAHVRPF